MKHTVQALALAWFALAALPMRAQVSWASVEGVYKNLVTAVGDGTKIAPPLKSSNSESRVAYYSPGRQTIFVEQKFLHICASFGKDSLNAVAFILGHELAHVYRNHAWVSSTGMGYVDTQTKQDWKAMRRDHTIHAKDETEADIFSGFYALVAGYNTMPIAGNTLKQIYAVYGIKDSIPGYPNLQQRMSIAENALKKSKDLYALFNVGIYSLAIEQYNLAAKLFTHIYNQDYAGAEILNNLAVAEILGGYKMYGESPAFIYPIFITTETALNPDTRGNQGEEMIRSGITHLKQALAKDEKNATTLLNLASAHTMLNEFIDAEYYVNKCSALNANMPGIQNLRAILAMKKGEEKAAKKTWKKTKKDDPFCAMNYATQFEKQNIDMLLASNQKSNDLPVIDGADLNDPALKQNFNFRKIKLPGMKVSYATLKTSTLYEVYAGAGKNYRFQHVKASALKKEAGFEWKPALSSTTTKIEVSTNYNVLRKTKDAIDISYIKYLKN